MEEFLVRETAFHHSVVNVGSTPTVPMSVYCARTQHRLKIACVPLWVREAHQEMIPQNKTQQYITEQNIALIAERKHTRGDKHGI